MKSILMMMLIFPAITLAGPEQYICKATIVEAVEGSAFYKEVSLDNVFDWVWVGKISYGKNVYDLQLNSLDGSRGTYFISSFDRKEVIAGSFVEQGIIGGVFAMEKVHSLSSGAEISIRIALSCK